MAVSTNESQANINNLLSQGVTQDYLNTQNYGNKLNPNEASRILSEFKNSDAYSASNVAKTLSGTTQTPSLSDPLGTYDYYLSSPEIKSAQTEYQSSFAELQKAKATGREQQTAIENLPQAINVIRGEQAQASQLSSDRIAALAEATDISASKLSALRETALNKFNISQTQRSELTSLITSNPGAGITYKDNIETASKKAYDFQVKTAQEEKKTAYKDSLKQIALKYGLKTSGNTKELEKRIKKVSKQAAEDAKKNSDLDYKTKVAQYQKLLDSTNGGNTIDIVSLFGGGTVNNALDNYLLSIGIDTHALD